MKIIKGVKGRKRKSSSYKKASQQNDMLPSDEPTDYPNNDPEAINDSSKLYVLENISNNEKNGEESSGFHDEAKPSSEQIKKQKKPPKKVLPGMNIGAYSDEEESLFLSGLEIYGRDWKKVSYKLYISIFDLH